MLALLPQLCRCASVGWENAYGLLREACASLQRGRADATALCANTAHLFADRLEAELHLPLIHLVTETAQALWRGVAETETVQEVLPCLASSR